MGEAPRCSYLGSPLCKRPLSQFAPLHWLLKGKYSTSVQTCPSLEVINMYRAIFTPVSPFQHWPSCVRDRERLVLASHTFPGRLKLRLLPLPSNARERRNWRPATGSRINQDACLPLVRAARGSDRKHPSAWQRLKWCKSAHMTAQLSRDIKKKEVLLNVTPSNAQDAFAPNACAVAGASRKWNHPAEGTEAFNGSTAVPKSWVMVLL